MCSVAVGWTSVGWASASRRPPELLGRLPAREVFPVGLWLRWDELDWLEAGRFLIERAFEGIRREVPEVLQAIINQRDERASERRCLFEACGMQLFQEKQGYGWRSGDTPPTDHGRLTLLTLERAGRDRFHDALGRAGENTLDRNDCFYREHAGEANWANVFLTLHEPAEAGPWLLALDEKGRDVGVVAVSRFRAPGLGDRTATITFIGVVPEQRGKGYVGDLLRAANEGALRAGFDSMLSDTDVLNTPMASAFVRNGHRADICTWHKWHYRMPR